MEKIFKIAFPVILLLGISLLFIDSIRSIGFIILILLAPLMLLYYLRFFKKSIELEGVEYRFKSSFLFSLSVTIFLFFLRSVFMSMHWPGGSIISVIVLTSTFITIIISGIYLYSNRHHLNRIAFEFIILFTPIVMLTSIFLSTYSYYKADYKKTSYQYYNSIKDINYHLYQHNEIKNDTIRTLYNDINKTKTNLITESGGMYEDGSILGWEDRDTPKKVITNSTIENEIISSNLISRKKKSDFKTSETVLEYLTTLTNIQIELLLKNQNKL